MIITVNCTQWEDKTKVRVLDLLEEHYLTFS